MQVQGSLLLQSPAALAQQVQADFRSKAAACTLQVPVDLCPSEDGEGQRGPGGPEEHRRALAL